MDIKMINFPCPSRGNLEPYLSFYLCSSFMVEVESMQIAILYSDNIKKYFTSPRLIQKAMILQV